MLFSSCTKYPKRQRRPEDQPVPPESRVAAKPPLRRRCDVEKQTNGSSFWGPTIRKGEAAEAGAAPPALPWRSMQHSDFWSREVSSAERSATETQRRDRAVQMRTESIRHGDEPRTKHSEAADNLRRFPREFYAGRVRYPPGCKHNKTKSEFYVSPAEVTAWRKGLAAMSHRQFCQRPNTASRPEVGLAEIQHDMLSSHFAVGNEHSSPSRGAADWSSQTSAVYSPRKGLQVCPERRNGKGESSVPLRDANLAGSAPMMVTTTATCFSSAPHRMILEKRRAAAAAQAADGSQTSRREPLGRPPRPEDLSALIRKQVRPHTAGTRDTPTRVHGAHSWQLGYSDDKADPAKYVTEQRLAFRGVEYKTGADIRAEQDLQAQERRGSRERIVHTSAVPL